MRFERKFVRIFQFNIRLFSIIAFALTIIIILFIQFNRVHYERQRPLPVNKYFFNMFESEQSPCAVGKNHQHIKINTTLYEDDEILWSNETMELFQDQLGLIAGLDNDSYATIKCRKGSEFILSALPGPDVENFYEVLWQYFSMDALEHTTLVCNGNTKLSLRALVTEKMKISLEQVFEGLPLEIISNIPSSCYNLKYAKILGNVSPIELKEITYDTPFLLDPKAKRYSEIAQRWALKVRPYWRIRKDIMAEVQQEFLVAKSILQLEASRNNDLNFIGVYITSDDKLPPEYYRQAMNFHRQNDGLSLFMVICDPTILAFCREIFEREKKPAVLDGRVVRKSTDKFDFALMSNCNSTIISNEKGVLHALASGGVATAFKPEPKDDPQFYIPFVVSEKMDNWYSISATL